MGEVEHTHYCSCGSRIKVTTPSDDALFLPTKFLLGAFLKGHQGEGHESVSAKECAKVRRRLEAQRRRETRAREYVG